LDGIPLAIELAATRLRSLSVAEVVARLDDRFGFLVGGNRAAQPRQQTLRAMIGWSHELCTHEEQLLWARLSVFAGSFDLAAVEGVCAGPDLRAASVVDVLDHLVAKSIVLAERRGERVRYRMLVTVREFGAELLGAAGEREDMCRRHRDHYLASAESMAANWCGPGQAAALARMRADHGNLTAALQWSLDRPSENRAAATFVAALRYHWVAGGSLGEGRRWLDQVLDTITETCAPRAEAAWVAAWIALMQGDGQTADGRLAECIGLARSLADDELVAHAALWSGLAALFSGELADSVPLYERAATGLERAGNTSGVLTARFQLPVSLAYLGELDRAAGVCKQAMQVAERYGERWARAYIHWATGIIEWRRGELDRAEDLAREALTSQRDFHDGICVALNIELLAWLASRRGEHRDSARLFGAARAVWSEIGTSMHAFGPHLGGDSVASSRRAEQALGTTRFTALTSEGGAVDLPGAIEFALAGPGAEGRPGSAAQVRAAPTRAAARGEVPLSRREAEVAGLIAKGLSNKAIAESLVISPRTVDGHVERILAKLGFASRAQVAAWVAEQRS